MNWNPLFSDMRVRDKVILALHGAIVTSLTEGDWQELGYRIGHHDYIAHHERLLRSLHWGDEDYSGCVFQFLNHILSYDPEKLREIAAFRNIAQQLEKNAPEILTVLGLHDTHVTEQLPPTPPAPDVVRLALSDAQQLLDSSGATSAIDRLHTALHGYLRSACAAARIPLPEDASITLAFKTLKQQHPALRDLGAHDAEVARVVNAFSAIIDALNTIRNRASVAHPNADLIRGAEASLVVNAVRTVFNYLVRKLD